MTHICTLKPSHFIAHVHQHYQHGVILPKQQACPRDGSHSVPSASWKCRPAPTGVWVGAVRHRCAVHLALQPTLQSLVFLVVQVPACILALKSWMLDANGLMTLGRSCPAANNIAWTPPIRLRNGNYFPNADSIVSVALQAACCPAVCPTARRARLTLRKCRRRSESRAWWSIFG